MNSSERGRRNFLRSMVVGGLMPLLLLGVVSFRDPEFEVGDRHDLGVSGLAGGLSGEDICLLVARCALVSLDPCEVDGLALSAHFANHVPDVPGCCLTWSSPGMGSSRNGTERVEIDVNDDAIDDFLV
jgi:hypothetical protein